MWALTYTIIEIEYSILYIEYLAQILYTLYRASFLGCIRG